MRGQRGILARSAPAKYCPRGSQKNLHVEPYGPSLAVTQIQPDHFVESRTVAPAHLPQARYARPHFQNSSPVPNVVNFKLVRNWRARANERHVSAQDVPELGEFVQTGLSQKSSDESHSRILHELVNRFVRSFGIVQSILAGNKLLNVFLVDLGIVVCVHGTELQALEA